MRKIYFVAEWLRDDCLTDEGFESDCIEQTNLDDLEDAKETAMTRAVNSPMYWARVTRVEQVDGMKEYGPCYVNEWVNGDWTGWVEDSEDISEEIG
jgi:hypothetical protein